MTVTVTGDHSPNPAHIVGRDLERKVASLRVSPHWQTLPTTDPA